MNFYSHIDKDGTSKKELKEHLKEVGEEAKRSVEEIPLKDKKFFSEIAHLLGISHDFGKYTSFFQEYLLKKKQWGRKSHHSLLSALFTAWQIQVYLEVKRCPKEIYLYMPIIGYFIVLHHHGDLGALEVDIPTVKYLRDPSRDPILSEKLNIIYEQVKDLKNQERLKSIMKDYSEMKVYGDVREFLNIWKEVLITLSKLRQKFEYELSENKKVIFPFLTLLLYSVLIDSDKRSAGEISIIERKTLLPDLVDRYKGKHFNLNSSKSINLIRNEVYKTVIKKIEGVSLKNHLFTLTAPTGSGKTLTAFSAALKLRARIEKEKGYIPRIIYSLPFITIIEQNYEIIRNVLNFGIKDFEENEHAYLLKHHHLTDLKYKEGNEDKSLDEALLLIESWQSEIIVTTFVQLLHTIIGFKNGFLKKYHNIAGSIILLDEVQNIPIEYWELIGKVIKLFSEYYGCYFILLTATRPLILKECETTELVKDTRKYFRRLNRVVIKSDTKRRSIDEFIELFKNNYDSNKSHLIVANTIASSKQIYEKIKYANLGSYIFYLSTNIIPRHRRSRIETIKEFLDRKDKVIVVSTQVVEAGVDLDFDRVIRDIGPIDSIIQAAGRCNREFSEIQKEVYVFCLDNFASYVYGRIHPDISKKLLGGKEIREDYFYKITNSYFEEVKPKINDDISRYIWEAMLELRYYDKHPPRRGEYNVLVSEFQLINERGEYADIFIEVDDEAHKIWKEYCNRVYSEKDFLTKRYNYLSIRKKFRDYIISIRKGKEVILPEIVCGLRYVPQTQLADFYSLEVGFKPETNLIW